MNKNQINEEINECVDNFNTICMKISNHFSTKFPKDLEVDVYKTAVMDFIKKKPREPISLFIKNVYANDKYRESIMSSNENFFTNNNFDNLTQNDQSKMDIMHQIKSYWTKLSGNSRKFIFGALQMLIDICECYISKKTKLVQ